MNHMFDVEIATEYGICEAIILNNLYFWCERSRANGKHYYDGHYWTYNSNKAMQELFPYMTERKIGTALQKLVDEGIILKGHYSANKYDRTLWYAFTEKGECIMQKCKMEDAKTKNRSAENVECNTDNNTNNKTQIKNDDYMSDGDERPSFTTVESYASGNLRCISPHNMEELQTYKESLPYELIIHAIDTAVANGVRNYSYVRAILNKYVDEGFQTVGEVEAYEEQRRRKRKGGYVVAGNCTPIAGETII